VKKLILGLVGEKLAGKGTVAEKIDKLADEDRITVEHLRFSDILIDIAELLGTPRKEASRDQLIELATSAERIFGKGCITRGMRRRVEKSNADIIMLDGIRWPTDVEMLRGFPNNYLVYVTASAERRHKRAKERKEKAGEEFLTLEEFLREEQAETEKHIPELGKQADYKIVNESDDISLLNEQVELCWERCIRPKT